MSIIAVVTFMPGRHSSSKLSHTAGASGLAWRLISNCTVLFAMIPQGLKPRSFFAALAARDPGGTPVVPRYKTLFRSVVAARARLDELHIDFFILKARPC